MAIRYRGIVSRRNRGCKYVRTGREPGGASRRDLAVGKPVRAQPTVCDAPQHLASGQDANPPAAGSATAPLLTLDGDSSAYPHVADGTTFVVNARL